MDSKLREFELNYKDVSKDIENNIVVGLVRATGKLEDVHTIEINVEKKKAVIKFKRSVSTAAAVILFGTVIMNNEPSITIKEPYFYVDCEEKVIVYVVDKKDAS